MVGSAARSVRAARTDRQARSTPGDWLALSGLKGIVLRRTLSRPGLLLGVRAAWLALADVARRGSGHD